MSPDAPESTDRPPSPLEPAQWCLDALRQMWTADPNPDPEQQAVSFGRFKLLNTLGGGGQGIVFRAYDPLLQRPVALKIARPEMLATPQLKARFLKEARVLAALDHPNLVTLLEAGQVGPALYLATALCRGPTLADWFQQVDRKVPGRIAAEIVHNLSITVHFLHERGVLHRDLKPRNVLLDPTPSDSATADCGDAADILSRYTLRLADFGLARWREQDETTVSGACPGTPAYMAPEQRAGNGAAIGVGTDVYALGVMLYELLTGAPPSTDHSPAQCGRSSTLLSPRSQNPDVPGELEAICVKCLEAKPQRRYRSARELADDLERYFCGADVLARKPPRIRNLIRTHRAAVQTTALAAAAILAALTIPAWQPDDARPDRSPSASPEDHAGLQRIIDLMEADHRWDSPDLQPYRRELIEAILVEFRGLRQQHGPDLELDAQIAHAAYRAAGIAAIQAKHADAVLLFDEAIEYFDQLSAADSDDFEPRLFAAKCRRERALCWTPLGDRERSVQELTQATELLAALAAVRPNCPKTRLEFAISEYELASRHFFTGQVDKAEELGAPAIRKLHGLVDDATHADIAKRYLAAALLLESRVHLSDGRLDAAWLTGTDACGRLEKLVAEQRDAPWSTRDLAHSRRHLAVVAQARGNGQESAELLGQSVSLLNDLIRDYPAAVIFETDRRDVAQSQIAIARSLQSARDYDAAEVLYRDAVESLLFPGGKFEPVAQERELRDDIVRLTRLIRSHLGIAQCALARRDADTTLSAANAAGQLLLDSHGEHGLSAYLATAWDYSGRGHHLRGETQEALDAFQHSYELRVDLLSTQPDDRALQNAIVSVCVQANAACQVAGRAKEADLWSQRRAQSP